MGCSCMITMVIHVSIARLFLGVIVDLLQNRGRQQTSSLPRTRGTQWTHPCAPRISTLHCQSQKRLACEDARLSCLSQFLIQPILLPSSTICSCRMAFSGNLLWRWQWTVEPQQVNAEALKKVQSQSENNANSYRDTKEDVECLESYHVNVSSCIDS